MIEYYPFSVPIGLQSAKASLQSKLTSLREQNRALDATIDNFRRQLDEAKQLIKEKDTEVRHLQSSHCTVQLSSVLPYVCEVGLFTLEAFRNFSK